MVDKSWSIRYFDDPCLATAVKAQWLPQMLNIAAIQTQSGTDLHKNLSWMESQIRHHAENDANMVVFPEMAYFQGPKKLWLPLLKDFSTLSQTFSEWAAKYQVFLVPGTLREPVNGDDSMCFNTFLAFDPKGSLIAKYQKIFLFQANLPEKQYRESEYCRPGTETTVFQCGDFKFGAAICYDLRFPELFRSLRKQGVQVVLLPSSFTERTGRDHWDALTRARAIENQMFLVAPGQEGMIGEGSATWGHTRVVSPWGEVLAEIQRGTGGIQATIDVQEIDRARKIVDSWSSRREDLFPL